MLKFLSNNWADTDFIHFVVFVLFICGFYVSQLGNNIFWFHLLCPNSSNLFILIFQGKDVILHGIASLCSSCHETISHEDPTMPSLVLEAMMSACSKNIKIYRDAAFSCLQQVNNTVPSGFSNFKYQVWILLCMNAQKWISNVDYSNFIIPQSHLQIEDILLFSI